MDTLEIHVAISPTAQYLTQVLYFAASRLFLGGSLSQSKLVVHVGDSNPPIDLENGLRWPRILNIEWRWIAPDVFARHGTLAAGFERFGQPFDAKYVLLANSDMLMTASIADLIETLDEAPAIAGLMAHNSPFTPHLEHSHDAWWQLLFENAGLAPPRFAHEYSGWGTRDTQADSRWAPPYFNFGFILAPAEMLSALAPYIYNDIAIVNATLPTMFRSQLALSLALARLQLPVRPLPLRYNFPNNASMAEAHGDELDDVRMLQYGDRTEIDKVRDFANPVAVEALLKRDGLNVPNRILQERLWPIHNAVHRLFGARQSSGLHAEAL